MKVIGITGGVGSGKSTVMNILEKEYGAKILLADNIGHRAMTKGCETYLKMVEEFGEAILGADGESDRQVLASIIFEDKKKLAIQNSIVHPFVRAEIERQLKIWKEEGVELAAVESAILTGAGCDTYCDAVWFVNADSETRIRRLALSRGYSRKKAEKIIANQLSEEEYIDSCDAVIDNNADIEKIYKQLKKSLEQLMSM